MGSRSEIIALLEARLPAEIASHIMGYIPFTAESYINTCFHSSTNLLLEPKFNFALVWKAIQAKWERFPSKRDKLRAALRALTKVALSHSLVSGKQYNGLDFIESVFQSGYIEPTPEFVIYGAMAGFLTMDVQHICIKTLEAMALDGSLQKLYDDLIASNKMFTARYFAPLLADTPYR